MAPPSEALQDHHLYPELVHLGGAGGIPESKTIKDFYWFFSSPQKTGNLVHKQILSQTSYLPTNPKIHVAQTLMHRSGVFSQITQQMRAWSEIEFSKNRPKKLPP
jgi:hypothetical protein